MPYFDTLEYVDAGGTTREIALALTNLAAVGGAVQLTFTPASHAPGTMRIVWSQPPETGIAIPFKSRCKIYASRLSTAGAEGTFSEGTILFQGRRTDNEGAASGSKVSTEITLSDAWWDLMHVTYQVGARYISGGTLGSPTYSTFYWPDVILFQADPNITYAPAAVGGLISTWQQIQDIIRYAAGYAAGADAVQIQLGGSGTLTGSTWSSSTPEFTPSYLNTYPLRSGKCGEALTVCLRAHPGVFSEMDYSTTPPTLHLRDRAHMTAITLPYKSTDGNGIVHLASNIVPLDELKPDAVRLFYKINGTFNGQPVVNYALDAYPSSTNKLLCLDFSVDVTGAAQNQTIIDFVSAAFDPTNLALWRARVPNLADDAHGGEIPASGTGALAFVDSAAYNSSTHPQGIQVIGDDGTDYSSSYGSLLPYITDQNIYGWFALSGGGTVRAVKATIKAFFSYNKVTATGGTSQTDKMAWHQHSFRVLLTNVPTGRQIYTQTLNAGEAIPSNLAQNIYTELSALQWRLRHEVFQVAGTTSAIPTLIKPGLHKINLSGGDSAWESMNAVPQMVHIEFQRTGAGKLVAHHRINCGPVGHLEPAYMVQLTNLFCNRNLVGMDANQRLNGMMSSSQVDLSATAPKENSVPSHPVPQETNNVYVVSTVVQGRINQDAKAISDLLGAGSWTAEQRTIKPREIKVCDPDTGAEHYAIFLCTEQYDRA